MTEVLQIQSSPPSHFPSSPPISSSSVPSPCVPTDDNNHNPLRFSPTRAHEIDLEEEEGQELGRKDREGEGDQGSILELLVTVFRRSIVGCSVTAAAAAGSKELCRMEIGVPTNVRHVAHVTFDRFNGFLGLPVEFEPEVPRRAPSASATVFGVSTESMQLSYDSRGNSVPTILLMMQMHLYTRGGLEAEGIFRINGENSQEEYVRDHLNRGVVPEGVDIHCLAGLIKAWFRELPTAVLDSLSPEQVMQSRSEEECAQLARLLPPTEAALLDWAVNLMADVAQLEHLNKMNARNIAMMSDPLTALMYAVQVMNFLKTLVIRTLKEREESMVEASNTSRPESSDENGHWSCSKPESSDEDTDEPNEDQKEFVSGEPEVESSSESSQGDDDDDEDDDDDFQNPETFFPAVENIPGGSRSLADTCPCDVLSQANNLTIEHQEGGFKSRSDRIQTMTTPMITTSASKVMYKCKTHAAVAAAAYGLQKSIIGRINQRTELVEAWRSASSPLSIPLLIKSCKTLVHLHQLHAHIIRRGLDQDHFIVSHLLTLSTSLSYSTSVFNSLIAPSTYLYNVLLKVYSKNRCFEEGFLLYLRMKRSDSAFPDKYTLSSLVSSCSRECRLREGRIVHGSAIRYGVIGDMFVGSGLIDLYGKCQEMVSAGRVFDEMPERNVVCWTALVVGYANMGDLENTRRVFNQMPVKNQVSWNAMITGLVKVGDMVGARKMFDEMPQRTVFDYTVLIDGYAKAGDMASAKALFDSSPENDIVSWSALISGFAQNGFPNQALEMFTEMELAGIKPDEFVMVSLMSACSQIASLEMADWVHHYLSKSPVDVSQNHVMSALIDMNTRCGNMARAETLFEKMPQRNLVAYCSMIKGYSVNGQAEQAVQLFNKMLEDGLVPDEVAFTVILSACSRAGLVEEGWHYFTTLRDKYSLVPSPEHYACMVYLLSRAGRLEAAHELLVSLPFEPHACAWGALLGGCKHYGNTTLAEDAAARLFELEPQNAANYVLLSDIYAASDRWSDVSLVREKLNERGLRKLPGLFDQRIAALISLGYATFKEWPWSPDLEKMQEAQWFRKCLDIVN
ncbi:Putative pentatricopeptide repeat-containing protein At5g37570 [Linum grandiflorum]